MLLVEHFVDKDLNIYCLLTILAIIIIIHKVSGMIIKYCLNGDAFYFKLTSNEMIMMAAINSNSQICQHYYYYSDCTTINGSSSCYYLGQRKKVRKKYKSTMLYIYLRQSNPKFNLQMVG